MDASGYQGTDVVLPLTIVVIPWSMVRGPSLVLGQVCAIGRFISIYAGVF